MNYFDLEDPVSLARLDEPMTALRDTGCGAALPCLVMVPGALLLQIWPPPQGLLPLAGREPWRPTVRAYGREFLETIPFLLNSDDFVFDSYAARRDDLVRPSHT